MVGVADQRVGAVGDVARGGGGEQGGEVGDVVGAAPAAGDEVVDLEAVAQPAAAAALTRRAGSTERVFLGESAGQRRPIATGTPCSSTRTGSMVALARSCSTTASGSGDAADHGGSVLGDLDDEHRLRARARGRVVGGSWRGCRRAAPSASAARRSRGSQASPLAGRSCSTMRVDRRFDLGAQQVGQLPVQAQDGLVGVPRHAQGCGPGAGPCDSSAVGVRCLRTSRCSSSRRAVRCPRPTRRRWTRRRAPRPRRAARRRAGPRLRPPRSPATTRGAGRSRPSRARSAPTRRPGGRVAESSAPRSSRIATTASSSARSRRVAHQLVAARLQPGGLPAPQPVAVDPARRYITRPSNNRGMTLIDRESQIPKKILEISRLVDLGTCSGSTAEGAFADIPIAGRGPLVGSSAWASPTTGREHPRGSRQRLGRARIRAGEQTRERRMAAVSREQRRRPVR